MRQPLAAWMPPSSPQGRVYGVLAKGNIPAFASSKEQGNVIVALFVY